MFEEYLNYDGQFYYFIFIAENTRASLYLWLGAEEVSKWLETTEEAPQS